MRLPKLQKSDYLVILVGAFSPSVANIGGFRDGYCQCFVKQVAFAPCSIAFICFCACFSFGEGAALLFCAHFKGKGFLKVHTELTPGLGPSVC